MIDEHEIQGLMETAMGNLRDMLDVNTIVGQPIQGAEGVTVIPVSRVCCGFVAGGGDSCRGRDKDRLPFTGGSGAGVHLQPAGFLVLNGSQVRLIPVCGATALDKAIEAVPLLAEQLQSLWGKTEPEN